MDQQDEPQFKRRATDRMLSQWLAVAIAALVAIGGTAGFTFNIYESIRTELVDLSTLQPTLTAHISADGQLHHILQSRLEYLERRLDTLTAATRANTKATGPGAGGDPTREALEKRIEALEKKE